MRRLLCAMLALIAFAIVAVSGRAAHADDGETPSALFTKGVQALRDGRASDAIAAFESLADRGTVDPVASYDRGLAYAMRVRIGAEVSGDLGRAAHGFEEARDLTHDARLADAAARALTVVRSEVARRRTRAGEPVEVDAGRSLARTVSSLLAEDSWCVLAAVCSAILAIGLFVRWIALTRRLRVGGGVAAGLAAPVLLLAVLMALAARHDRLEVREAVVVTPGSRPSDQRGIVVPGSTPLPEGARVEVVDSRDTRARIRFGALDAWVPESALREIARWP
ncbi:MAG TPA: hypothetical protein VMI75_31340 [Polyangiaceae bacterium]|nr:hypothetical protein [Polyangiaceae bacterium]